MSFPTKNLIFWRGVWWRMVHFPTHWPHLHCANWKGTSFAPPTPWSLPLTSPHQISYLLIISHFEILAPYISALSHYSTLITLLTRLTSHLLPLASYLSSLIFLANLPTHHLSHLTSKLSPLFSCHPSHLTFHNSSFISYLKFAMQMT